MFRSVIDTDEHGHIFLATSKGLRQLPSTSPGTKIDLDPKVQHFKFNIDQTAACIFTDDDILLFIPDDPSDMLSMKSICKDLIPIQMFWSSVIFDRLYIMFKEGFINCYGAQDLNLLLSYSLTDPIDFCPGPKTNPWAQYAVVVAHDENKLTIIQPFLDPHFPIEDAQFKLSCDALSGHKLETFKKCFNEDNCATGPCNKGFLPTEFQIANQFSQINGIAWTSDGLYVIENHQNVHLLTLPVIPTLLDSSCVIQPQIYQTFRITGASSFSLSGNHVIVRCVNGCAYEITRSATRLLGQVGSIAGVTPTSLLDENGLFSSGATFAPAGDDFGKKLQDMLDDELFTRATDLMKRGVELKTRESQLALQKKQMLSQIDNYIVIDQEDVDDIVAKYQNLTSRLSEVLRRMPANPSPEFLKLQRSVNMIQQRTEMLLGILDKQQKDAQQETTGKALAENQLKFMSLCAKCDRHGVTPRPLKQTKSMPDVTRGIITAK